MSVEFYSFLANTAFVLHGLFLLASVPSLLLALYGYYCRRPCLWALHNSAIATMAIGQTVLRVCPLVALEQSFRERAGEDMWYSGSYSVFVIRWLTGFQMPVEAVFVASITLVVLTALALLRLAPSCWTRLVAAGTARS